MMHTGRLGSTAFLRVLLAALAAATLLFVLQAKTAQAAGEWCNGVGVYGTGSWSSNVGWSPTTEVCSVTGSATLTSDFTVPENEILHIAGGLLTIADGAVLTNYGRMANWGGTVIVDGEVSNQGQFPSSGIIVVNPGGTFTNSSGFYSVFRLTNYGTISNYGGELYFQGGTTDNYGLIVNYATFMYLSYGVTNYGVIANGCSAIVTGATSAPAGNPVVNLLCYSQTFDTGNYDWNTTDVTVYWNWFAAPGGLDPDSNACTTSTLASDEGRYNVTAQCADLGGNVATGYMTVAIDKSAPSLGDCPAGGPYSLNSGAQTAGPIEAIEELSGLNEDESILSGSVDTSTPGAKTVIFYAVDWAGNAVAKECSYQVNGGDAAPPTAVPVPSPAASNGWNNSDVTVAWNWSEEVDGSGIDPAACTASSISSGEGVIQLAARCRDLAGNEGSAAYTVQVDKSAPVLDACPAAGPFFLNSGVQSVGPVGAGDGVSGLNTAASTLNGSLDTGSIGNKTVAFAAVDNAGNNASVSCSYSVIYSFSGFFQPVDNPPVLNRAKAGKMITVKFSLAGNQGLNVLASGSPTSMQITCPNGAAVDNVPEEPTVSNNGLSYDAATDQYNYKWKTDKSWENTCRQLNMVLADGTIHAVVFAFTK